MKRFLLLILLVVILTGCTAPIDTVTDPEWDVITIDGVEYIKATHEYDIYGRPNTGSDGRHGYCT